jgi:hypothetical protein
MHIVMNCEMYVGFSIILSILEAPRGGSQNRKDIKKINWRTYMPRVQDELICHVASKFIV